MQRHPSQEVNWLAEQSELQAVVRDADVPVFGSPEAKQHPKRRPVAPYGSEQALRQGYKTRTSTSPKRSPPKKKAASPPPPPPAAPVQEVDPIESETERRMGALLKEGKWATATSGGKTYYYNASSRETTWDLKELVRTEVEEALRAVSPPPPPPPPPPPAAPSSAPATSRGGSGSQGTSPGMAGRKVSTGNKPSNQNLSSEKEKKINSSRSTPSSSRTAPAASPVSSRRTPSKVTPSKTPQQQPRAGTRTPPPKQPRFGVSGSTSTNSSLALRGAFPEAQPVKPSATRRASPASSKTPTRSAPPKARVTSPQTTRPTPAATETPRAAADHPKTSPAPRQQVPPLKNTPQKSSQQPTMPMPPEEPQRSPPTKSTGTPKTSTSGVSTGRSVASQKKVSATRSSESGNQVAGNPWRQKIVELYQTYNPSKVLVVDELLSRYKGREEDLWRNLKSKYNSTQVTPVHTPRRRTPGNSREPTSSHRQHHLDPAAYADVVPEAESTPLQSGVRRNSPESSYSPQENASAQRGETHAPSYHTPPPQHDRSPELRGSSRSASLKASSSTSKPRLGSGSRQRPSPRAKSSLEPQHKEPKEAEEMASPAAVWTTEPPQFTPEADHASPDPVPRKAAPAPSPKKLASRVRTSPVASQRTGGPKPSPARTGVPSSGYGQQKKATPRKAVEDLNPQAPPQPAMQVGETAVTAPDPDCEELISPARSRRASPQPGSLEVPQQEPTPRSEQPAEYQHWNRDANSPHRSPRCGSGSASHSPPNTAPLQDQPDVVVAKPQTTGHVSSDEEFEREEHRVNQEEQPTPMEQELGQVDFSPRRVAEDKAKAILAGLRPATPPDGYTQAMSRSGPKRVTGVVGKLARTETQLAWQEEVRRREEEAQERRDYLAAERRRIRQKKDEELNRRAVDLKRMRDEEKRQLLQQKINRMEKELAQERGQGRKSPSGSNEVDSTDASPKTVRVSVKAGGPSPRSDLTSLGSIADRRHYCSSAKARALSAPKSRKVRENSPEFDTDKNEVHHQTEFDSSTPMYTAGWKIAHHIDKTDEFAEKFHRKQSSRAAGLLTKDELGKSVSRLQRHYSSPASKQVMKEKTTRH